jgi:hypothetical protein
MKHLKKFNESKSDLSKDEEELIKKFQKLLDDKDTSRSQKVIINKVISDIKSGKL